MVDYSNMYHVLITLGEIIEWLGFAILNLEFCRFFVFLIWTACNLTTLVGKLAVISRSIKHHDWIQ